MTSRSLVTVDFQHAHSMGMNTYESHTQCELAVLRDGKAFGEDIGYLISRRDVLEFDVSIGNTIPNKMVMDTDMFHTCMESRVNRECKGTLVIAQDCGRNSRGK